MGVPRLTAGYPITPFRIHVAKIEIMGLEDMHVAVENFVTLFRHRVLLSDRTKPHYKNLSIAIIERSEASRSFFA
jgi:hypothetical protein